MAALSSEIS